LGSTRTVVELRPTRFTIGEKPVRNYLQHLDTVLAGLTALASLGELAHLFQAEWIVFVLALATFISEFFKPKPEVPTIDTRTPPHAAPPPPKK
jgi:hypothetical protein